MAQNRYTVKILRRLLFHFSWFIRICSRCCMDVSVFNTGSLLKRMPFSSCFCTIINSNLAGNLLQSITRQRVWLVKGLWTLTQAIHFTQVLSRWTVRSQCLRYHPYNRKSYLNYRCILFNCIVGSNQHFIVQEINTFHNNRMRINTTAHIIYRNT